VNFPASEPKNLDQGINLSSASGLKPGYLCIYEGVLEKVYLVMLNKIRNLNNAEKMVKVLSTDQKKLLVKY